MKKIISIILMLSLLLTPVMSLASSHLLVRSDLGSALQETIVLNNIFAVSVPKGMQPYVAETDRDGVEHLIYLNEETVELIYMMAYPIKHAETPDSVKDSLSQSMSRYWNGPTRALLEQGNSRDEEIPLTEKLCEVLGENNGILTYSTDGEISGFQLIFVDSENQDFVFSFTSYGIAGTENELLSRIETLRRI